MASTLSIFKTLGLGHCLDTVSLLSRRGGMTLAEIAAALSLPRSSVRLSLDRLHESGLVSMDGDYFRVSRSRLVELSHAASALAAPPPADFSVPAVHPVFSRGQRVAPHELIDV